MKLRRNKQCHVTMNRWMGWSGPVFQWPLFINPNLNICLVELWLEWIFTCSRLPIEYNEGKGFSHKCCYECIPGNCYHWSLGILSVDCFLAAFVCLGLFYPVYDQNNHNAHCAVHESVTSVSIILAGLTATFSVLRGDGSFGVAAMICFYSTFLLFSAMQADPDAAGEESCNLFHSARNGLSQEALDRKSNVYFHNVMMLAAAYMSMLFTNWAPIRTRLIPRGRSPSLKRKKNSFGMFDGMDTDVTHLSNKKI